YEDIQVVFPIHKRPEIREKVINSFINSNRINIIENLNYENHAHDMNQSHQIITDSEGIQEDAPSLGKPVLVARKTTERKEGLEAGTLKLVGTTVEKIVHECSKLINDEEAYQKMAAVRNPFGEGDSAVKILHIIKSIFKTQ